MTNIKAISRGRPAKKRIEKQQRVVSTKLDRVAVLRHQKASRGRVTCQ